MSLIDRIKRLLRVYRSWYGDNVRVVLKQETLDKLLEEMKAQGIEDIKEVIDCSYQVYDKIITDFYVTQKLN